MTAYVYTLLYTNYSLSRVHNGNANGEIGICGFCGDISLSVVKTYKSQVEHPYRFYQKVAS